MADEYRPIHGEGRQTFGLHGLWGELSAELFGTFVLICFGDGVVAMAVAALPGSGRTAAPNVIFAAGGDWLLITLGWAFAVMVGVYVAGGVSGAHINPAVTLALAVRRRFPWNHVIPYWVAQVVGAFLGAALVYWVYMSAIGNANDAFHIVPSAGNALTTYSIFATFPAAYFHGTIGGPFVDEAVGTALLVLGVLAVTDARNTAPLSNLGPLIVGFVVFAVGTSFGANSGYAINPARDFGPRMFAWVAGWGQVAFPGTDTTAPFSFSNYFWIPIIGPLFGGICGALAYDFFIGDVLHARKARTAAAEPVHPGRAEANVEPAK
ncbi:MAG TPA: MIP/aquaporin family protein [Candidatus Binatia bacterium]|nr:MIP/aquaporin family protein [Candidatus Binatia bacterium]